MPVKHSSGRASHVKSFVEAHFPAARVEALPAAVVNGRKGPAILIEFEQDEAIAIGGKLFNGVSASMRLADALHFRDKLDAALSQHKHQA